jgi:hypothetical protein
MRLVPVKCIEQQSVLKPTELHIPAEEIENLLFGLAGDTGEPLAPLRPPLRLISN